MPGCTERRLFVCIATLALLLRAALHTQAAAAPAGETPKDSVFQLGEELVYNVSYASFDIGRVRITLVDTVIRNNRVCYKAVASMDSYRGVPFVSLHAVFEDSMDSNVYSRWFFARQKEDQQWISFQYVFDYEKHAIYIERGVWETDIIQARDTLRADSLWQDGLSLFYFARKSLYADRTLDIPTLVSEKKGTAKIDFRTKVEEEEIDAVSYPIDVVHFEGEAGFVGVFGLTGGFEGWFSNDGARVPVLAKMKVIIGSIRIELVSWKRQGWVPPRSVHHN